MVGVEPPAISSSANEKELPPGWRAEVGTRQRRVRTSRTKEEEFEGTEVEFEFEPLTEEKLYFQLLEQS